MKYFLTAIAIASCIMLTTSAADQKKRAAKAGQKGRAAQRAAQSTQQHIQRQQAQQRQRAMTQMRLDQRVGASVSRGTMYSLDPYTQRQAQQYNGQVAAKQAAFTARATGQRR
jgi:hypothetical protein